MISEERLFARHLGKSILLDSNLLLVFLTGAFDPSLFSTFKRTSTYNLADFRLLQRLLQCFSTLLTTPHLLTEISNLANSLPAHKRLGWFHGLAALIGSQRARPGLRERWMPASELALTPEFAAFGISDAAVCKLAAEALVVSEDYRLSGALKKKGIQILNFKDLQRLQHLF